MRILFSLKLKNLKFFIFIIYLACFFSSSIQAEAYVYKKLLKFDTKKNQNHFKERKYSKAFLISDLKFEKILSNFLEKDLYFFFAL